MRAHGQKGVLEPNTNTSHTIPSGNLQKTAMAAS